MLNRLTFWLTCGLVLVGALPGCQESAPEGRWTADSGVDSADANADGTDDTDAKDVPDLGTGDARDGGDVDAGSECSEDTDHDALSDCEEAELCTDPTDGDTDGDGLSDYEEIVEGTNPCKADTDDDGVDDKTEFRVGLDPNKPSTFDDGIRDRNRWRVGACYPPEDPEHDLTDTVDYYTNETGNYRMGLPPGFSNFRQLALKDRPDPIVAGVFSDPSISVYGFILSKSAEMGRTKPDTSLREMVRPEILALAGDEPDNLRFETNTKEFETHDYKQAAIGRYLIESPSEKSAAQLRQELLLGMDAFSQKAVGEGGLPSTEGQSHDTYWIFVSVISRSNAAGPSQALISAAVAPASTYESRAQVRFDMADVTNATNIAEVVDRPLIGCERFMPDEETPKTFFYWVLDQSDSMAMENETLTEFSRDFIDQVQGAPLSSQFGVTNMDPRNRGRLYNPWTADTNQFLRDIRNGVIECTGWNCSADASLAEGRKAAYQGVRLMDGWTSKSPPTAEAIPDNSTLVTVLFTEGYDGSIHGDYGRRYDYFDLFRGIGTTAFTITGTQGCAEDGPSLGDFARSRGGRFGSVCPGQLEGILSDIVATGVSGRTEYWLSETPLSASLSVFVESDRDPTQAVFVPRNRQDGFDYVAQDNSIAFYGDYRPEPSEGEIAEDFVAARFEYFVDRCLETEQGADNCQPEE
jgi:hypothetical protein